VFAYACIPFLHLLSSLSQSCRKNVPCILGEFEPLVVKSHARACCIAVEKLAFAEEEALTAGKMEPDEGEMDVDVDDEEEDELAGGRGAARSSPCGLGEKKRRLLQEQVRALERCFETDNKLDPDRKARIARDLALQPRQVAVWFQNRRARWKTKTLERDFSALRARHDALRADCDALRRDKDALAAEVLTHVIAVTAGYSLCVVFVGDSLSLTDVSSFRRSRAVLSDKGAEAEAAVQGAGGCGEAGGDDGQ